jgi:hypothetical protein
MNMLDDIQNAIRQVNEAPAYRIEPTYAAPSIPIIRAPHLPDTTAYLSTDLLLNNTIGNSGQVLIVGTQPPTDPIELARREARLAVRRGLADVLAWLGQPVVNEPVLARLQSMQKPAKPIWMPR